MVIFSPLGVFRIARSTWRSMTKRLLGIIGLLNFAPVGTFHYLFGLPGFRVAGDVSVAVVDAAAELDMGADAAVAAPEAGATSEASSPQAAKRATNLERTTTPTWHRGGRIRDSPDVAAHHLCSRGRRPRYQRRVGTPIREA